jgi:hypothetical protein
MSISSTGLYGSATIVNSDLFNDVEDLKEQVTTLSSSYLTTTNEHRMLLTEGFLGWGFLGSVKHSSMLIRYPGRLKG